MPTLCSHIVAVFFIICILVYVSKCEIRCQLINGLPFKVTAFIGLFKFDWQFQNEAGNIAILMLWRYCEKLYSEMK